MFSTLTTIYRFTPPTCTLEITANRSPLDKWTQQETVKNLQFKLSFDDPRMAEEEQISIEGNRAQLEQLYAGVIDYVQIFLQQSFHAPTSLIPSILDTDRPYLKSQGLVNHQLYLGCLANRNATSKIKLSAVQLFDLVTALEEYNERILALPQLNRDHRKQILPIWGSIAAGAILAIGLTGLGIELARNKEKSLISSDRDTSTVIPQLETVKPPQVSAKKETPTPKPKPNKALSSTKKLPPPAPVDLPKPPPDVPDSAQSSLPKVAKKSRQIQTPDLSGLDISSPQQAESEIAINPKSKVTNKNTQPKEETIAEKDLLENTAPETQAKDSENESIPSELSAQEDISSETTSIPLNQNSKNPSENSDRLDIALNSSTNSQSSLQQVTQYFQDKWQPPVELNQSLEYRLTINPDGTIARIVPIGKVSEQYLTLTNIPLQGESFIEPLAENRAQRIRLLLNPNGGAIAFKE